MFYPFQKNFLPYYAGFCFLIIPIAGLFYFNYPMWSAPFTSLFALAYLGLVHLKPGYLWLEEVFWHYILIYIVLMTYLVNGNMMWFLFFPSNLLIWRFESRWLSYHTFSFLLALAVIVTLGMLFITDISNKLIIILVALFILVMTATMMRTRKEERLRDMIYQKTQENAVLVAENERNRIGRDLHDTLGHTFAMLTLKTELALKQLDKENTNKVRQELEEMNQISRQSMQEVRTLINHLKYRSFDEELVALTELLSMSEIEVTVYNHLEDEILLPLISSSIVMILRELVTNIIKHAEASQCHIVLKRENGIFLSVSDNGKGFSQLSGQELESIRERLELIAGQIEIVSQSNPTLIQINLREEIMS